MPWDYSSHTPGVSHLRAAARFIGEHLPTPLLCVLACLRACSQRRCSVLQWNPDVATQLVVASDDDRTPTLQMWDLRNSMTPVKEFVGHTKVGMGAGVRRGVGVGCRALVAALCSSMHLPTPLQQSGAQPMCARGFPQQPPPACKQWVHLHGCAVTAWAGGCREWCAPAGTAACRCGHARVVG